MLCGRVAAYAFLVTTRHPRLLGHASAQAATQQLLHHPHFHTGRLEARRAVIMAAADNDVRVALRKLLPTVDMDTTSERKIRGLLAEQLGTDMEPHKKLIKEEIDTWLTATAGGDGDDGEADLPPSSLDPVGKRKRAAAAAEAGGRAAKVARSGANPLGTQLDEQGLKWLSISTFKGQQRVDIRTFYEKDGELAPTQKGASLNQAEWGALVEAIPAINQALDDHDDDFMVQLSTSKRATISTLSKRLAVDVREYYQSDGEWKPGKKGINLLPDQWDILCEAAPDINKQLKAPSPPAAAAAPAAKAGARQPAAAAAAAAAGPTGGGGSGEVQLGGKKRAEAREFKGQWYVDLRETYDKDGQTLPGKKGIMLRPDQWRALAAATDDVTAALNAHNTRYALELGNMRRVTVSEFKGVWYVGVREFYEQGGELKPGSKGLSMNREQWNKLVDSKDSLSAQLG